MAKKRRSLAEAISKAIPKVSEEDAEDIQIFLAKDGLGKVRVLPTGFLSMDRLLGCGGIKVGHFALLHGSPGSGKTTAALQMGRVCQERGGVVIFMDFEHKLSLDYAVALGLDLDNLVISRPGYIENGFATIEAMLKQARGMDPDRPIVIVWDSLQAAPAKRTYEKTAEDIGYPMEARAYSHNLRRVCPMLARSNAIVLCVDQVRAKMDGYIVRDKYGVGNACEHYFIAILAFGRAKHQKGKITKGKPTQNASGRGAIVEVEIVKNQLGGEPHVKLSLNLSYGGGFDTVRSIGDAALDAGYITRSGSGYTVALEDGDMVIKGKEQVYELLAKRPDIAEALVQAVRDEIGIPIVGEDK